MYPPIEPFTTGMLQVSDIHSIYYEVSGKKGGNPVVFLHVLLKGGPGGATSPDNRTFFDPSKYEIVLLDQRGCGRSIPFANLEENTTWDLVEDIERLRKHLAIDKWVVFGGSWGSTLSLAYAQTHPDHVKALILRGIFTMRQIEIDYLYYPNAGTSHIFPEEFEEFIALVPEAERDGDIVESYKKLLHSSDPKIQIKAAKAWSKWEMSASRLVPTAKALERAEDDQFALAFALIENHYFSNRGWLREGQLVDPQEIAKIQHIPCVVVQGRYDCLCPMSAAWALKKAYPELELNITLAGHSSLDPENAKALVAAADKFADL